MGKSDPPPAPDYTGAAEAQGASSQANILQQTYANRPRQVTPWGSTEWYNRAQVDPASGQPVTAWSQEQTLNPGSQRALDATIGLQGDRASLAGDLMGRSESEFRSPIGQPESQWGSIGDYNERRQGAEDAAYGRATARLDPRMEQMIEGAEVKLRNQGLQPGDEAYDRAMEQARFSETDAYAAAEQDATAAGRAESQLAYNQQMGGAQYANQLRQAQQSEELQRRGWSLNEINAIMSGQQVAQPAMPGFQPSAAADATNYLGATGAEGQYGLDAYGAQQAGLQGLYSGLGSLGSAAIGQWG